MCGIVSGKRKGIQGSMRPQAACHPGTAAERRKMRLRPAGAHGLDAVGIVLSYENPVRLRACGQPPGGQMDALPFKREGTG